MVTRPPETAAQPGRGHLCTCTLSALLLLFCIVSFDVLVILGEMEGGGGGGGCSSRFFSL